jgi:two-component system chemotaxis response regulator CheB
MRTIKAYNGLTIAQDPTTAEASTMPQTAINAGVVDRVLTLAEIANYIANYFKQEFACDDTRAQ